MMIDGEAETVATPEPVRPGERLAAARVAQGLDLADIAARTRIPQRHLESIESGSYSSLPSPTYAMGFARAYARAVGVEETAIAADVRADLSRSWDRPRPVAPYDDGGSDRTAPRGVVWAGVVVAALIVLGIGLWYGTDLLRGRTAPAALTLPAGDVAVPIPQTVAPPPAARDGQVVLTATDEVWVRIYDGKGTTLAQRTMAPGERFEVPPGVDRPMINVGRPDKLAVTVNGSAVPPLGDGRVAIRDVPISADALLARGRPAASPTPTPTATTRPPAPAAQLTSQPALPAAFAPRASEPVAGNAATPD